MKSIFDNSFRYKPSFETDVKKTFDRIRRELAAKLEQAEKDEAERKSKVTKLKGAA